MKSKPDIKFDDNQYEGKIQSHSKEGCLGYLRIENEGVFIGSISKKKKLEELKLRIDNVLEYLKTCEEVE